MDEERNPIIEDIREIAYHWTADELALKISILGAFFERYFMPIHLDLKRACVELLVNTNQIKSLNGASHYSYNHHDDMGVVDIKMNHTVTLGNLRGVAVGPDTVFGKYVNDSMFDNTTQYIEPIGVQSIDEINNIVKSGGYIADNNEDIATFYTQLKGGVGVIIPIKVSVNLPEGDGIKTEVLTVYDFSGDNKEIKAQITDHKLFKSVDGIASFTFNLLSTKEEKIAFSLTLYSISGYTFTAASSYECVDISGNYLDVCVVKNTDNGPNSTGVIYSSISDWVKQTQDQYAVDDKNPFAGLYPNVTHDSEYFDVMLKQYLPSSNNDLTLYNQLFVIENDETGGTYNINWINNWVNDNFWVIRRAGEEEGIVTSYENPKYIMLISKSPGITCGNKSDFLSLVGSGIISKNIKRMDIIFIPQLHLYNPIELMPPTIENYTYTQNDLLCVIPHFKKNLKITQPSWEYINMTTLEKIVVNQPVIKPVIAGTTDSQKTLSPGYWTVNMYYKLSGSNEVHKLSKNSAFRIA